MANPGEKYAVAWGRIEPNDNRLGIPREVLNCVAWYEAGKGSNPVLVELREPGCLRVHDGLMAEEVAQQRQTFLEEFDDKIEARRRIAVSRAVFIPTSIGKSNRRVGLQASTLDHLGVANGDRVLCFACETYIEVLSERRYAALATTMRVDINLDTEGEN